jgi:hypothetical protein
VSQGDNRAFVVFEIHVGTHIKQGKTVLFMSILGVKFRCQNGVFGVKFRCQNGVFGVKTVFLGLILVSKWCFWCQNGVRGMVLVTKSCSGDGFGEGLILNDGGCHFGIPIWDPRRAIVFGCQHEVDRETPIPGVVARVQNP